VSTDYCPWVIDNDPDEGEIRCGTELRATTGPRGTFESVCTSGHRFVRCCCHSRPAQAGHRPVTPRSCAACCRRTAGHGVSAI
jgi:hypothetical protein